MFCNDLTAKLQMWSRNLPDHCSLSEFNVRVSQPFAPHKINLYLTFTTLASCFYIINDLREITPDFFFPSDILPSMSSKLIKNFRSRLLPSRAPFLFEYFCTVSVSLTLKNRMMDRQTTYATLELLNELATIWEGAEYSKQYFSKMQYRPATGLDRAISEPHGLTSVLEDFATAASIEASLGQRLDIVQVGRLFFLSDGPFSKY
jgi:hypothetical protein